MTRRLCTSSRNCRRDGGILRLLRCLCVCAFAFQVVRCQATLQEEYCNNKYVFVVKEISRLDENGGNATGVSIIFKDTGIAGEEALFILGEGLPSACGDHFTRCNMTLLTESTISTSPTSLLLVPLQRGVAQVVYEKVNSTLQLVTHHILPLPSQVHNCQLTSLLDLRETPERLLEEFSVDRIDVVGLCLNETSPVEVPLVNISIDFANPSKSRVLPFVSDALHQSPRSPGVLSNFVPWLDQPHCLLSFFLLSPMYYFRSSQIGLFDTTNSEGTQEFFLYYQATTRMFVCPSPRQLIRISDDTLILYCDNGSAEINICKFVGDAVQDVIIRESSDGVRYFCSGDMDSFVSVSDKVATFNSSTGTAINVSLPLASDEEVFIGSCIPSNNGDSNDVRFMFTSTRGNTFLAENLEGSEPAVVIQERAVSDPSFVHHQVYGELAVYNSGTNTVLLNASCLNRVTLEHQFSLSLVVPGEGLHRCDCRGREPGPDVTTAPDHTPSDADVTSGPGKNVTEHDNTSSGINIVAVVVPIVIVTLLILVVVILIIIVVVAGRIWRKKMTRRYQLRALNIDGESGTKIELTQSDGILPPSSKVSADTKDDSGQNGGRAPPATGVGDNPADDNREVSQEAGGNNNNTTGSSTISSSYQSCNSGGGGGSVVHVPSTQDPNVYKREGIHAMESRTNNEGLNDDDSTGAPNNDTAAEATAVGIGAYGGHNLDQNTFAVQESNQHRPT